MLKTLMTFSLLSVLAFSNLSAQDDDSAWTNFLSARADAIEWLKEDKGYNDSQIAQALSIDEHQVYQIRTIKIKLKTPN